MIDAPFVVDGRRLIWRGGVEMKADSPNFGGWSDLHVSADGRSLTSISDEGARFTATIDYSADGNLADLGQARIGQLRGREFGFHEIGVRVSLPRLRMLFGSKLCRTRSDNAATPFACG